MGNKWGSIPKTCGTMPDIYRVLFKYLPLLFLLPSHLITAWTKLFPRIACLLIPLFVSVNQPFCLFCNASAPSKLGLNSSDWPIHSIPSISTVSLGICIVTKDMMVYVSWQWFPCCLCLLHILTLECKDPGRVCHYFGFTCVFSCNDYFISLEKCLKFCLSVGPLMFSYVLLKNRLENILA